MKNNDKMILPKLRFKGFNDSWYKEQLGSLADKVVDKNTDLLTRVLTNSAIDGIVDQKDYFEREIVTTSNMSNYFVVDKNDYVYNPRISAHAPVGPISKNNIGIGVMSPLYTVFRFKDIENDFFEHFFKSHHWHKYIIDEANTGARFDRISISDTKFMNMPIALPTEKEEQQKIADCLTALDDLINAENQKLELLKEHKKGLMQKLFPAEGKTMPEWRFPEFRDSGEWVNRQLSKLGSTVSGLTYKPDDIRNKGLLVLRSSNIQDNKIRLDDNVYVKTDIKGANLAEENDILICVRNGSTSLIGKSALIPRNMPLCTHGAFMTVFRANNPQFVFQLFQSVAYDKQVKADLGATINSINSNQLKKYIFCIPTDEKEQNKIADCLSSVDNLISKQAKKVEQLKEHKKGLLQGLFPSLKEVEE